MSTWHDIKKEDIEIDKEDINIYLETISDRDDSGNVYATIKRKYLEDLFEKKSKEENEIKCKKMIDSLDKLPSGWGDYSGYISQVAIQELIEKIMLK